MTSTNPSTTESIQRIDRDTAILDGIELVQSIARRIKTRLPSSVHLDDLISAGTLGLIQAVDRFDMSRGFKFSSYAKHRIAGAMQDFLRAEDPLSRSERKQRRESGAAVSSTGFSTSSVTVSLEQIPSRMMASPSKQCFDFFNTARVRQCLNPRENEVLSLLFYHDWTSNQIAVKLGVNESRVSQIKKVALAKLRLTMSLDHYPRAG